MKKTNDGTVVEIGWLWVFLPLVLVGGFIFLSGCMSDEERAAKLIINAQKQAEAKTYLQEQIEAKESNQKLRDEFAKFAMQGIVTGVYVNKAQVPLSIITKEAYRFADKMMEDRLKSNDQLLKESIEMVTPPSPPTPPKGEGDHMARIDL